MRNVIFILVVFLFVIAESKGQRQVDNNDLLTVDVTKSYSTKKELILQDFMDVEYIVLETNDEFVNQGIVMDIGKNVILVRNKIDDGDIFVYDRSGKALRKINNKGQQNSREYTYILGITLDEDNNEMFVNDHRTGRILAYDLYGNFKRSFRHKQSPGNPYSCYTSIFNYDKKNLICYYEEIGMRKSRTFVLISKKDGSIVNEFKIPYKEHIPVQVTWKVENKNEKQNEATFVTARPDHYRTSIPFKGAWSLLELSSDTVYTISPKYKLHPFLVRTPPIQSMNLKVFLLLNLFSDRYYFMATMKGEYDKKTETGFPRTSFMYDRQEKEFFKYAVYNGDYSTKKEIDLNELRPVNHEIESWQLLESFQLVEDYEKGILKGKLKEIAGKLDEEDNPVILLIKHKK